MPTEVILPKVDMDMATGQISRWFYKEGDAIKKGEPLFEIETDKAAMEVDAPASGTLRNVTGAEGVDIAVGSPVAWIYAEGEAVEPSARTDPSETPQVVGPDPDVEVDSPRVGERQAEAIAGGALKGDGESSSSASPTKSGRNGVRATPLARRIARERGIDLAAVAGSGPLGRIQREDVERAVETNKVVAPTPTGRAMARAPERVPEAQSAPRRAAPSDSNQALHLVSLREGNGTPIVLIHGFGSESASWRPLLAEIADATGPVIGIDLAGHGGSVDVAAPDFDGLVAGVEEALTAAGFASCHLVGHSLGGAVATAVAAGTSADIRSLMLIAPAGFGPGIDTQFAEGFARATEEAPVRTWLRHLVADPASLSDSFVRATARSRADGRHAEAQTALVGGLFSNGTQHFEVRSLAPHLAMPVKIVVGAEDRVVPPSHFSGLPGAIAVHVFPRTGHLPQIERRAEVARLLRELTR